MTITSGSVTAVINHSGMSFSSVAIGYKAAADELVRAAESNFSKADKLAMPICFLYRHYIELQIKHALDLAQNLLDEHGQIPMTHNLPSLWRKLTDKLKGTEFFYQLLPDGLSPDYDQSFNKIVLDFNQMDPGSYSFRYHIDKSADPAISKQLSIDIRKLCTEIEFLESQFAVLHEQIKVASEVHREMKQAYEESIEEPT